MEFLESGTWFSDSKRVLLIGHQPAAPNRNYALRISDRHLEPLTQESEWGHLLSQDDSEILLDHPLGTLLNLHTGNRTPARGLASGLELLGWTDQPHSVWIQQGDLPAKVSRLDLTTGSVTPWRQIGPADLSGAVTMAWLVITPDGQAYAYSYFKVLSELYLISGLS